MTKNGCLRCVRTDDGHHPSHTARRSTARQPLWRRRTVRWHTPHCATTGAGASVTSGPLDRSTIGCEGRGCCSGTGSGFGTWVAAMLFCWTLSLGAFFERIVCCGARRIVSRLIEAGCRDEINLDGLRLSFLSRVLGMGECETWSKSPLAGSTANTSPTAHSRPIGQADFLPRAEQPEQPERRQLPLEISISVEGWTTNDT